MSGLNDALLWNILGRQARKKVVDRFTNYLLIAGATILADGAKQAWDSRPEHMQGGLF